MASPLERMLASTRAFVVAPAGCGKTELLTHFIGDGRSRRQLVLTHTHAGVASLRKRLNTRGIPPEKYRLDTIAGWCLRYAAAYPEISGAQPDAEARPNWSIAYPAAERVVRTKLGQRILSESYDGVLVDEYQDCSRSQHAVIRALAHVLPCRAAGDPMQAIFDFRKDDPCVSWEAICSEFEVIDDALRTPWRWKREGHNAKLGAWLSEARSELKPGGCLPLDASSPIVWAQHGEDDAAAWSSACHKAGRGSGSVVAILRRPPACLELAKRMGGRWPLVERFDDPALIELAEGLARADGRTAVSLLLSFLGPRMIGARPALRPIVEALAAGRTTGKFRKNKEHAQRFEAFSNCPTPASALTALEGVLDEPEWLLFRHECASQLCAALRECSGGTLADLPDAVASARTRARHRGRLPHGRMVGTCLLVKGLEFDHAVVLCEPDLFSPRELYVALTRGSKSLTVVSRSRELRL